MTVSKIASEIYQAAKIVSKGEWNWRLEWSKAMKQAYAQVINKVKEEVMAIVNVCKKDIAEEIARNLGGNVWAKAGRVRVYVYKNYIAVNDDGIDVTGLGRNQYEEMMAAAKSAAAKYQQPLYQIYRGYKRMLPA
jgi:ribosomal protein L18